MNDDNKKANIRVHRYFDKQLPDSTVILYHHEPVAHPGDDYTADGEYYGFRCPNCGETNQLPDQLTSPMCPPPIAAHVICEDCKKRILLKNIHYEVAHYQAVVAEPTPTNNPKGDTP